MIRELVAHELRVYLVPARQAVVERLGPVPTRSLGDDPKICARKEEFGGEGPNRLVLPSVGAWQDDLIFAEQHP